MFNTPSHIDITSVESPTRKLVKAIAAEMPIFQSKAVAQHETVWLYNQIVVALDFLNKELQEESLGSVQRTWTLLPMSIDPHGLRMASSTEDAVAMIGWAVKAIAPLPTKIDVTKIDTSGWL